MDEPEMKIFNLTAKKWAFEPSEITANEGDIIKLIINSVDVEHGISIPEFDVEVDIVPGQETTVVFEADKKGIFSFSCSIYCGSGHKDMAGTITID